MNGRLTNNGLIIMANGDKYLLTDLVKYYKKNNFNEKNVYYDEKKINTKYFDKVYKKLKEEQPEIYELIKASKIIKLY